MKYNHIVFICILTLIVLYTIMVVYRNIVIVNNVKRRFKPYHKTLTDMLRIVLTIFKKYDITYCIYDGTLLGYARHNKSYIPWDDDIDLAVFRDENFKYKLTKLREELKKYDMSLNPGGFGFNITQKGKEPYIDLFIYKLDKKNKRYVPNRWALRKFPREYFLEDEVFPMKQDYFDKVLVNIPSKYKKFLYRVYDKDCLTNYKLTTIHHASILEKIIIYITQRTSISS